MADRDPKEAPSSDSKDKDNANYLKRREQVRRAQRTHRERKEQYIKSLENEVLSLRTNEAKILQESRTLRSEVGRLRNILEQHGIPYDSQHEFSLPSQPWSGPPSSSSVVSVRQNPHKEQQLHVRGRQHPSQGTGSEFYLSESDGSSGGPSTGGLRNKLSIFRSRGPSNSASPEDSSSQTFSAAEASLEVSASNLNIRDLDPNDLGMEFVLSLEAPCLHHTQGDPHEPHAPSGHALTASAPLLFQSPNQPVNTTSSKPTNTWETPNIGLEKLLELSTNFELADELTPVQAWHQLRSHPDFSGVDVPSLRRLTEDTLKHVKCYGFGAVIDTETFGNLARNLFPNGGEFEWHSGMKGGAADAEGDE